MRQGEIVISSALAMLGLGVVMVVSAGTHAEITQPEISGSISGQIRLAILASISMLIGHHIGLKRLIKYKSIFLPTFVIISLTLLTLVLIPGIGVMKNGARRWIDLGIIGFQPSEVAKWIMPICIAYWSSNQKKQNPLVVPLIFIGILFILIAKEDLGTAILISLVGFILIVSAGGSVKKLLIPIPIGLIGISLAIISEPYRLERLKTFLNPFSDPSDKGYHIVQSLAAISNGGLTGTGLGQGIRKLGYLPEDTTDFLYAIICEEIGFSGAVLLFVLTLAIVFPSISMIKNCKTQFTAIAGLGILLTFVLQGLINLFVVTGLAPTKGIALPLISSGGTGWIMTATAIGFLSSLDKESKDSLHNSKN